MKLYLTAAAMLLASSAAAGAATAFSAFSNDSDFKAPGACIGESCVIGVGELRLGNAGGSGDFEVLAGKNTACQFNATQFAWPDNQAIGFTFSRAGSVLSTTAAGADVLYDLGAGALPGHQSLLIRGRQANGAIVVLSDLKLGGMAISGVGGFDLDAEHYQIAIGSGDFTLMGSILFDFSANCATSAGTCPGKQGGSHNAVQFKLTSLEVSTVPLPAAAWMLLSGLVALGALRLHSRTA